MAKKKKRRKAGTRIPVALLAGFIPLGATTVQASRVSPQFAGEHLLRSLTGFDVANRKFDARNMWLGTFPILGGMLAHKFIGGGLGVNRALGSAGVPFLRI